MYHTMEVPARGNCFERWFSTRQMVLSLSFTGLSIISGIMISFPSVLSGLDCFMKSAYSLRYSGTRHLPEESNRGTNCGWAPEQQAIIMSSYFCGYLLSSVLIDLLRNTYIDFSGKWLMLFGVMTNILGTLLIPFVSNINYFVVVLVRFNMGIGGGLTWPALKMLLSKWTLPADRCAARSNVVSSTLQGFAISCAISGFTGAVMSFYVMAGLSLIWCLLWVILVQDSPQQQPFISIEERTMIVNALEKDKHKLVNNTPVPWRDVMMSHPVLTNVLVQLACNWGFFSLLNQIPAYLRLEGALDRYVIAMIMAISFTGAWMFSETLTKLLKWMQKDRIVTKRTAQKIAAILATGVPSILIFVLSYHTYDWNRNTFDTDVILFVCTLISSGSFFFGCLCDFYDMAPNYAEKLIDVCDTIVIIPRIIVPIFLAGVTDGGVSYVFLILGLAGLLYIIVFILYFIFGSADEQYWNGKMEKKASPSEDKLLLIA